MKRPNNLLARLKPSKKDPRWDWLGLWMMPYTFDPITCARYYLSLSRSSSKRYHSQETRRFFSLRGSKVVEASMTMACCGSKMPLYWDTNIDEEISFFVEKYITTYSNQLPHSLRDVQTHRHTSMIGLKSTQEDYQLFLKYVLLISRQCLI